MALINAITINHERSSSCVVHELNDLRRRSHGSLTQSIMSLLHIVAHELRRAHGSVEGGFH